MAVLLDPNFGTTPTGGGGELSHDVTLNTEQLEFAAEPSIWQLTKKKFPGYLRWTAFAIILAPIAVFIFSSK